MGHPSFIRCPRRAEILRWESLALPRTPLPQDDVNFPTLTSKSTTLGWATLCDAAEISAKSPALSQRTREGQGTRFCVMKAWASAHDLRG